jgi:hypothetical protein
MSTYENRASITDDFDVINLIARVQIVVLPFLTAFLNGMIAILIVIRARIIGMNKTEIQQLVQFVKLEAARVDHQNQGWNIYE